MIDPLSQTTARLSISQSDESRLQVKEFLNTTPKIERRDSAVSLSSIEDSTTSKNHQHSKRRRSSNQSGLQPPQKREKLHKRKLKKQTEPPKLQLNLKNDEVNDRFPFKNFRDVILRVFNVSQGKSPKWLQLEHSEKISKVVLCFCPGLELGIDDEIKQQQVDMTTLARNDELSFLYNTFDNCIKCVNPGSKDSLHSAFQSIINVPLTKNEKKKILDAKNKSKITIHNLLLTEKQLKENNYPIDDKFQQTIERNGDSRIYALDCEFCKSNYLQVLTRISLIDFNGEVVIDELVKPTEEITDYVTKYSGITEEMLSNVETTIDDVQKMFVEKVCKDDILIGHSLESDLIVMKIRHEKIVDTSIIYEHNRGLPFKPSLRWLSERYLGRTIQNGEDTGKGHSSIEDAKACLDLVKLKIIEGMSFGRNLNDVSIFSKLNEKDSGVKSLVTSYYKDVSEENVEKIQISNDDEGVERVVTDEESRLVILNLKDLEVNLKWVNKSDNYTGKVDSKEQSLIRTNQRLQRIYDWMPNNSLFILYSQSESPLKMYDLQTVRQNFQKYEKEGGNIAELPREKIWDIEKYDELVKETNKARNSLAFVKLKTIDK